MAVSSMDCDVVCVGAGPVGTWLAWKMAAKGHRVVMIEARSFEDLGRHIKTIHLDRAAFEELEIPLPEREAPIFGARNRADARRLMKAHGPMIRMAHPVDWDAPTAPNTLDETEHVASYGVCRFWGFDHSSPHVLELDILSLSFPLFLRRLHGLAAHAGVEILYETDFHGFLAGAYGDGRPVVKGIIGRDRASGEARKIRARVTVDCTGWPSAARRSLPDDIARDARMDTAAVASRDLFTTYLQLWRSDYALPQKMNTFTSFKGFFIQLSPNEWTVGIGAPIPPDQIRAEHLRMVRAHLGEPVEPGTLDQASAAGAIPGSRERFAATGGGLCDGNATPLPFERQITAEYLGFVPLGQGPPGTLVANGFAIVGDAARMNKPYNGEGMQSGMWAARILLGVLEEALRSRADPDDPASVPDRDRLWPYNVRYFRGIGADFAEFSGSGRAMLALRQEDFDFIASRFVSERNLQELFTRHRLRPSPEMILRALPLLARRPGLMIRVLGKLSLARAIRKAHLRYPEAFDGFERWLERVTELCGRLATS